MRCIDERYFTLLACVLCRACAADVGGGCAADDIPVIDLGMFFGPSSSESSRAQVAAAWDGAMVSHGAARVINHGVDAAAIDALFADAGRFFGQDPGVKGRYNQGKGYGFASGYTPAGGESVARSAGGDGAEAPPDLVESFVFHNGGRAPDVAAEEVPTLASSAGAYWDAMHRLMHRLHRLSASALGLRADFFDAFYAEPEVALRLAYYPPTEGVAAGGSLRYGAHTDYQGFTILRQDPQSHGLEVQREDGAWQVVEPDEGSLVINAGDLVHVWTNGRWKSPTHRVPAPASGSEAGAKARLSMVFFTGPSGDALIEPIRAAGDEARFPPVRARDHLVAKLAATNV